MTDHVDSSQGAGSKVLRSICGFVLGWVSILVVPFVCILALTLALFLVGRVPRGEDLMLDPGTVDVSVQWHVLVLGIRLVACIAGGWVAARIGGGRGPAIALGFVVVASYWLPQLAIAQTSGVPLELSGGIQGVSGALLAFLITDLLVGLLGLMLGAWLPLRGGRRRGT